MTEFGSGQETTLQSSHLSRLWSFLSLRGGPALPRARVAGCPVSHESHFAKGGLPQVSASMTKTASAGVQRDNVNAAEDSCGEPATSYGLSNRLHEYFDLGRVLGQGGNATVVRAVSRHTGKEYAVKCIRKVCHPVFRMRIIPPISK